MWNIQSIEIDIERADKFIFGLEKKQANKTIDICRKKNKIYILVYSDRRLRILNDDELDQPRNSS